MTWTLVQKGTENAVTGGTTTPALPGASTAGTLLVACLTSRTNVSFTAPAGWIQGPVAQAATTARAELWYYPANPGGISSAAFTSGTLQVRGVLSEYNSDAGTGVLLDLPGTATGTGSLTLPVTAGSANAAGDLAVCSFAAHYATSQAITWTDPSGFTLIDSEGGAGSDHAYAAYDLSVPAATLTVTGTVSVAPTSTAGVTATIRASAPAVVVVSRPVSRCGAATGTVPASDPSTQKFISLTKRPLQIRHMFFGNSIPGSLAASDAAGDAGVRKVLIDFNLADKSGAGTSVAALNQFLASCQAGGLDAVFTLWHEPYNKFANAAAYINALGPYVPVIHSNGYLHAFDPTAYSVDKHGILPAWWPGSALADVFATDFYSVDYFSSGVRLDNAANFADSVSAPFALYEFGVDQQLFTEAQGDVFLNYVHDFIAARISAGKSLADVILWDINTGSGGVAGTSTYDLATAPASYVTIYRSIFDLTQGSVPSGGGAGFALLNLSASSTGQPSIQPSVYPAVYAATYGGTAGTGGTATAVLLLSAASATPGFVPLPPPPRSPSLTMPAVIVSAGLGVNSGDTTSSYLFLDDPVRGTLDSGNTLAPFPAADITAWVDTAPSRVMTIVRGSNRGEDPVIRYDAGTCQIPLDNTDRRFDPTNLAGPYVAAGQSQVVPMVVIKVQATWAGVTYDLFTGFADAWVLNYAPPSVAEATVTATDAFKVFAAALRTGLTNQVGAGELSGARVNRILDNLGWPAALRKIAAGDTALQGTFLAASPMDELNLTCDSESGELYIDGGGAVFFRNRHALLTDTRSNTPQVRFGDNA